MRQFMFAAALSVVALVFPANAEKTKPSPSNDLSGVYALYQSDPYSSPSGLIGSDKWASQYVRFTRSGVNTYKGAWYHPTIQGRNPPACAYAHQFEMTVHESTRPDKRPYPVVTIVQSGDFECDGIGSQSFATWAGSVREAGTGQPARSISGELANNNGNHLSFIFLHEPAF